MIRSIFVTLLFASQLPIKVDAASVKYKDLVRDAKFATQSADHYKAIRIYRLLEENEISVLTSLAMSGYLKSLAVISTDYEVLQTCKRIQKKAPQATVSFVNYHCGRQLLLGSKAAFAYSFLSKIKQNESLYPYALTLLSASYMRSDQGQRCSNRFDAKAKKQFEKQGIIDLFYLSKARCQISKGDYRDALQNYQQISQESPHYFSTLNEVGWLYFRLRDLERANEVFNIVTAAHRSFGSNLGGGITQRAYFFAKYLRAYLEIIGNRRVTDFKKFESIKHQTQRILKHNKKFTMAFVDDVTNEIYKKGYQWIDLGSSGKKVKNFQEFAHSWSNLGLLNSWRDSVDLSIAVSKEYRRIKKLNLPGTSAYLNSLARLLKASGVELKKANRQVVAEAKKAIQSIELKADMGKLEADWVNRNEGIRDANHLLRDFQESVKSVEDYLGG